MKLKYRQVIEVACFYHRDENANFVKGWKIVD
jgi:hypothetical protein